MIARAPHPEILTRRLRLYAPDRSELEAHLSMNQDPEVMRYIGPLPDPQENRRLLERRLETAWPEVGAMFYVSWRDRQEFLGWCGLWPLEDKAGQPVEIGYRYRRAVWGQGIGSEAAGAVLAYGFETLGLDPVVAVTDHAHRASQAVLRKIGLRRAGNVQAYGEDVAFFVARREAWLAQQKEADAR